MQLVVVGINHTSGPVGLREQLSVAGDALPGVLAELRERVTEALVLSTCHRVELYALCGHASSGAELLRQELAARSGVPIATVRESTYTLSHETAVRHLFRVASGLDSVVIGEQEILGQVRRAQQAARTAGSLGPLLDRLANAAIACGRRARTATSLGIGESVASVAVRLAMSDRAASDERHVLLLGAGETACAVVKHLATHAGVRVTIVNRTLARAVELARATGADVREWTELPNVLSDADIVFACTGSRTPIVDAAVVGAARRESRDLLLVDLGLPRDVDPATAQLPGVRLIDLQRIGVEATRRRGGDTREIARAEAIVTDEADRYMHWWRGRAVAATVTRLHERGDEIREAELARAFARLPGVDDRTQAVIRDLATRMAAKLLHAPTLALKQDPEGANMAIVVQRLFALGADAADLSVVQTEAGTTDSHQTEASVA